MIAGWAILQFQDRILSKRMWIWITAAVILLSSARIMYRNTDWKSNSTLYTKSIKTAPNSTKMWYCYSLELHKKGKEKEALESFKRTVRIYPDFVDAWLRLAILSLKKGDNIEAMKAADAVERIYAQDYDYNALLSTGAILMHVGEYPRAKNIFERILEKNQLDYDTLIRLGKIYMIEQDYNSAEECYLKAYQQFPTDPDNQNALLSFYIDIQDDHKIKQQLQMMRRAKIPIFPDLEEKTK
jgi:tetratricopeptide (TPR) repeat protein